VINFLNFDGSGAGSLPAGFANITISGHVGNFQVQNTGSISSPNSLHDASGQTGASAVWTGFQLADEAIQFDQVVNLPGSGGVMNPLIRLGSDGQSGYGALISWSTPKIDFVKVNAGGSLSTIASPAIPAYVIGAQVTVKLEVQGANLRFKSWLTGTAEPSSWTASITDSTYSSAGYCGFSNGGGAADNVYFGPAGSTFSGGFVPPVLSSGSLTSTSAQLNWTSATQSGGTPTYQLLRSLHGANVYSPVPGATTSPSTDGSVSTAVAYDYKVTASDGINAPVSSNVVTLTIPTSINPYVLGSGQGIRLEFLDSSAAPSNIVAQASTNDVQTLTLIGTPTSNQFQLTLGSQTTAEIPSHFALPDRYALFTLPVTPGIAYTVALNTEPENVEPWSTVEILLIDGATGSELGPTLLSNDLGYSSPGANIFTEAPDPNNPGTIIKFKTIGTVTPTTTSLLILYTQNTLYTDPGPSFHIQAASLTAAGGSPVYYGTTGSMFTSTTGGFLIGSGGNSYQSGTAWFAYGYSLIQVFSNGGLLPTVAASDIQSALQGLSNVGSGNMMVVDQSGNGFGPFVTTAVGSLANQALPTLTTTSPAFTIAHTMVGGQIPTITINGGSPILLERWYWGQNVHSSGGSVTGGYSPLATNYFFQQAPTVQYYGAGEGVFVQNGSGWVVVSGSGYSLNPIKSANTGDSVTFYLEDGIVGDTYQLAMTWIADSTLCNDAQVVISGMSTTGLTTLATITLDQSVAPASFSDAGVMWHTLGTFTTAWPTTGLAISLTNPGPSIGAGPAVSDSSFETPTVSGYQYNPTGTAWTFTSTAGISQAGGPFNPSVGPPDGTQAAFIQNQGTMSQSISGWAAGNYTITFYGAQRSDGSHQTFNVLVDGNVVGTFTPPSQSAYTSYTTPAFTVTAGSHTIEIAGTVTGQSGIIDEVSIQVINPIQAVSIDSVQVKRTTTNTSIQIQPSDLVTLTMPAGFFTTAAGPVAAVTNQAVTNLVHQSSLPFTSNQKTMGAGYNVEPDIAVFAQMPLYSNLAQRLVYVNYTRATLTLNSLGYPTSSSQPAFIQAVASGCILFSYGDKMGIDYLPSGPYVLQWDGPDTLDLFCLGNGTATELLQYQSITGAANNQRVYNIQPTPNTTYSPDIWLSYTSAATESGGTYALSSSNFRIYPPDPSDPTFTTPWGLIGHSVPPKWHPATLTKLSGAKVLRFMDWCIINDNAINLYSDFRVPGSLTGPTRFITATIATISAPTAPLWWYPGFYPVIRCTFDSPHGIFEEASVVVTPNGTLEFSDGSTMSGAFGGDAHVVSPTVLDIAIGSQNTQTMTNTLTGGTVSVTVGQNAGIFLDAIDLCNTVGANFHCNIPNTFAVSEVATLANAVLSHLNPSLKVIVEYGNEHWNDSFGSWFYFINSGSVIRGNGTISEASWSEDPTLGYVANAVAVQSAFMAEATSLGKQAMVIKAAGGWAASGDTAVNVLSTAAAAPYSMTFDQLLIATYWHNQPYQGVEYNFLQLTDELTPAQSVDFQEDMLQTNGFFPYMVGSVRSAMDTAGFTGVEIGGYEGGWEILLPGASTANAFRRTYQILADPRTYWNQLHFLQGHQDAGMSQLAIFYMNGSGYEVHSGPVASWYLTCWPTWHWWNQQPGTGSYATDTANVNTPMKFNAVKSETGGGISRWNSLVPALIRSGGTIVSKQFRTTGVSAHGYKHI
jgi:hypothetical protein